MKNIFVRYCYDGSGFFGSQKQPGLRTVQGELEKALRIILPEKTRIITAGRTDRGVHALEQVSNFDCRTPIPTERLFLALRNLAPPDIGILEVKEVDFSFNARFSAKEREYKYVLSDRVSPFTARYTSRVEVKPDIIRLGEILDVFTGEHNFRNFMLVDTVEKNPVKKIFFIRIEERDGNVEIKIRGNSFGKSQIRLMIGAAMDVYAKKRNRNYIRDMLTDPMGNYEKKLAPPNGLYLSRIIY